MKPHPRAPGSSPGHRDAFSLVEVTIAIGIFAFVVVGVLGLFPTALKMRGDASRETRGVLIARELLSSVAAAPDLSRVVIRDGPGLRADNLVNPPLNLTATNEVVVVGYPAQTSVPYFLWANSRSNVGSPDDAWFRGSMPPGALANGIETLARLSARPVTNSPGLYQVLVEVRSPASVPLVMNGRTNTNTVTSFSTYGYAP
jgi:type II secretory pathway pseudopilin PulG